MNDLSSRATPHGGENGAEGSGRAGPLRVTVLMGTRPEAVKLAPVVMELRRRGDAVALRVMVTGQHREMLDQVLEVFGIQPNVDLDLMAAWQGRIPTLAELTARAVTAIDGALEANPADVVVVQGDTTTAFAGALAGFYRKIAVVHVEAGLRTHDRYDPFPEELNRRLISSLAGIHFAPTESAAANLLREGVPEEAVIVTGNTVVDALQSAVRSGALDRVNGSAPSPGRRRVLVTLHRRESWGEPMARACRALRRSLDAVEDLEVLFPMHRNPLVREVVRAELGDHPRVSLTEPLDYVSFLAAYRHCAFVVTDSGGVQEEAPALGKPVLVLRDTTERPEGVAAGTARLVGTHEETVYKAILDLAQNRASYEAMARAVSPYGDGHAAERIVDALLSVRPAGGPRSPSSAG